jgi:beta-N-acetylhexosaminidase
MEAAARAVAKMFAVGFDGKHVTPSLEKLLDRGIGAVVLFSRNVESPQQVARLCFDIQNRAKRPVLIAVDQEGGRVMRLRSGFTSIPSMRALGSTDDENLARQVGQVLARELQAVNIHMDLAPVMDVDSNPANPVIGDRSFSADPDLVSRMGCALLKGLQSSGVAACAKHFPGHGDTSKDSHFDLPRLPHPLSRLEKVELPPFQSAISAGVSAIMTAHVIFEALDPAHPATISHAVLTRLLRQKMGFDGVIISDALEMKAISAHFPIDEVAVKGANAGLDLLAICENPDLQNQAIDALALATERGIVPWKQIERANRRIDRLMKQYVRPPADSSDLSVLGCPEHRAIVERLSSVPVGPDPTERSTS